MPLIPRPGLNGKTILRYQLGILDYHQLETEWKQFHVSLWRTMEMEQVGRMFPLENLPSCSLDYWRSTQTKPEYVLKEPFFFFAHSCLHLILFCSFIILLSVYSSYVHSIWLLECKRPKILWLNLWPLSISILKIFFPTLMVVHPNFTQIQPQSFLRVPWKAITLPTLWAHVASGSGSVFTANDDSSNAPRERSSADVHLM